MHADNEGDGGKTAGGEGGEMLAHQGPQVILKLQIKSQHSVG